MNNQLTKLEQFTLAAMQVLMAQTVNGKPLNTVVIAEKAVEQAQKQLISLALVQDKG